MEQNKLGRRSDAEVLNLVLGDLPAISDYFINLDLGIFRAYLGYAIVYIYIYIPFRIVNIPCVGRLLLF